MSDITEIVSKEAIKGIQDLTLATEKSAKNLLDMYNHAKLLNEQIGGTAFKDYAKTQKEAANDAQKLQQEIDKLNKQLADHKAKTEQNIKTKLEQQEATRKQTQATKDDIKVNQAAEGSYAKLNAQYQKNLHTIKEMKVTNEAERKQRDDLIKVTNKQNDELKKMDATMGNHQRNVGNYAGGIMEAADNMGLFGGVMPKVNQGLNLLKTGFGSLKAAIMSTGIGSLVIAVLALINYFKGTAEGAEKLRKVLAPIKAIFETITNTLEKLGSGLAKIFSGKISEGWKEMKQAVLEVNDELEKQLDIQSQIADLTNASINRERNAKLALAVLNDKIAEQRLIAMDEENYNTQQQLAAIKEAMSLTKAYNSIAVKAGEDQLELARLKLAADNDSLENIDAFNEATINLLNIKTEASNKERELLRRTNTLINKNESEQVRTIFENTLTKVDIIKAGEQEITENLIEHIELRNEAITAQVTREEELRRAGFESEQAYRDERNKLYLDAFNQAIELSQAIYANEINQLDKKYKWEIAQAGDNKTKKVEIEKKYNDERAKLLRKQAELDKAAAIFKATISLAQAVIQATTAGPGIGLVLAALTAVFNGLYLATIIATPIPQFAKGTKSAKGGKSLVGEAGRELAIDPLGNVVMFDKPTVTNIKPRTRIFNNKETEEILQATKGYDSQELKQTLQQNNRDLIQAIKDKRELTIIPSKSKIIERQGSYFKEYFNAKVR